MKHIIKSLSVVSALALMAAAGSADAMPRERGPTKSAKPGKRLGQQPVKPGKRLGQQPVKPGKRLGQQPVERVKKPAKRIIVDKPARRVRQPVVVAPKTPVKRPGYTSQRRAPSQPRITAPTRPSWSFKIFVPPMTYSAAYTTAPSMSKRWTRLRRAADFDRNGIITKGEVIRANRVSMVSTGKTAYNLTALFARYDRNNDGVITKVEFLTKPSKRSFHMGYWM